MLHHPSSHRSQRSTPPCIVWAKCAVVALTVLANDVRYERRDFANRLMNVCGFDWYTAYRIRILLSTPASTSNLYNSGTGNRSFSGMHSSTVTATICVMQPPRVVVIMTRNGHLYS